MAVRREAVRLELEDDFSRKMLTAAAATKTLQAALGDLDGTNVRTSKSLNTVSSDTDRLSTSAVRGTKAIDTMSGRLGIMVKVAGLLGPALVPIGAVAAGGVAALASQFGFLALGISSVVIAAQGVGEALSAVEKAELDPTVENLRAARDALVELDPAARRFVAAFQEFQPVLRDIRDSAAAGFFPGLTASLDDFERAAPMIGQIMQALGQTGGNLISDAAESLAGPEWGEFMRFIAREAPSAFDQLGRSVGNVALGMAHLWQAFDPLTDGANNFLLNASRGFERWADGLAQTQGFQEFVGYVQVNGPKVAEAVTAIANAILQIAQAAAPLGGPVLDAITGIANAIAAIADSPLGTPIMAAVAAMSALSIASNIATASIARTGVALGALGAQGASARLGATAAAGGPWGLVLTAIATGALNATNQVQAFQNESQGLGESILRTLPGIREITMLEDFFGGSGDAAADATPYVYQYGGALRDTSRTGDGMAASIRSLNEAIRANAAAALTAFSAQTAYREALKAARGQGARNEAGIRGSTEAALNNRNALSQLAGAWNAQSHAVRKNVERSREAKANFIDVAQAMGVPEAAARRLAARLLDIPEKVETKANMDESDVQRGVRSAERLLTGLNGTNANTTADTDIGGVQNGVASAQRLLTGLNGNTAHTYVYTHHITTRTEKSSPGFGPTGAADGAFVPKTGRPYMDRHHYLLADGEGVTTNRYGETDRSRRLIEGINAGRINDSILRGLARGGFASRASERAVSASGGGGRSTVVVRDRFPDKVTLRVGGREFTAYVEGIATDVADRTLEGSELMSAEIERAG